MKVKEIMHAVTTVPGEMPVSEIATLMERRGIGSLLVESFGEIVGIITERDLITKVIARNQDPRRLRATQILTPVMYTIDYEDELTKASELFQRHNIRRLPVTKEGRIVGEITTFDVAKALPLSMFSRISSTRAMEVNNYPSF